MIEIPHGVQIFVLLGIALVIVVVPIRILFEMTKDSRERGRRSQGLADRLKERFRDVERHRGVLGLARIRFSHEGRPASLLQPVEDMVVIRLEPSAAPRIRMIARTRGSLSPPLAILWEPFRVLPRMLTSDPLIDESIALYASPLAAGYLREAALDGIPAEGKPSGLAESFVILGKVPGVRKFEVRVSPGSGFRLSFWLRSDDLLYRTDELESAVYHAYRICDFLSLS